MLPKDTNTSYTKNVCEVHCLFIALDRGFRTGDDSAGAAW